ncbi:hypothetical protein [Sediminicoccus rosea]|jgi:hypothetical protein|uniref:Uncharacterized protein n=1 Tax=Sediminicoccus rosea TaxID=1225128 RepID=A0ABZ0PE50_9PROT|nr:hypothetical protein [Sediminicoccus rosea]WPB83915.1 hypothetical protein R9Z33_17580 [Sediminicoccus rosea]
MRALAALLCLALPACAPTDFDRPYTWHATGVNDVNLRAMLADPRHAVSGVAAATDRARPGVDAIQRLNEDRRRPLPDSRAAQVGAAGSAPVAAPPAGGMDAN